MTDWSNPLYLLRVCLTTLNQAYQFAGGAINRAAVHATRKVMGSRPTAAFSVPVSKGSVHNLEILIPGKSKCGDRVSQVRLSGTNRHRGIWLRRVWQFQQGNIHGIGIARIDDLKI